MNQSGGGVSQNFSKKTKSFLSSRIEEDSREYDDETEDVENEEREEAASEVQQYEEEEAEHQQSKSEN